MQTGESADSRSISIESQSQRIHSDEARYSNELVELELDLAWSRNKYVPPSLTRTQRAVVEWFL